MNETEKKVNPVASCFEKGRDLALMALVAPFALIYLRTHPKFVEDMKRGANKVVAWIGGQYTQ